MFLIEFFKKIFGICDKKVAEKKGFESVSIQNGRYVLNTGDDIAKMENISIRNIEVEDFDDEANILTLEATLASSLDGSSLLQDMTIDKSVFERLIADGAETILEENPYRNLVKRGVRVVFLDANSWSEKAVEGLVINQVTSAQHCGKDFAAAFQKFYGERDVKIFISRKVECETDAFSSSEEWENRIEDGMY